MRSRALLLFFCLVLGWAGCSKPQPASEAKPESSPAAQPTDQTANEAASQPAPKPKLKGESTPLTIPTGTIITVRLGQAVGTKISSTGDTFAATVAEPVTVDNKVVVPSGAKAQGIVAEAVPRGRFKGAARLRLALNSVTINGVPHQIQTASVSRSAAGKGKRTATMIGGGAGLGALIGGLAGGGKGAAIGAIAGAGAGTAGSAFTGNQDIVIPAESALSFKLLQPMEVKK